MYSKLTLLAALILSFSAYSQRNFSGAPYHRFQIGVNIAPERAYRTLTNSTGNDYYDQKIEDRNKIENPIDSYTGGLGFTWNINHHIGIETGAAYTRKGFQYDYNLHGVQGIENVNHVETYSYLDIPLKVNFTVGEQRLRVIGSIGAAASVPVENKWVGTVSYTNGESDKLVEHNLYQQQFNVSAIISGGLDYSLTDRVNLRLEPTFRMTALPLSDSYNISERYWNLGLNVGCYIGL
jgi:hypothetical protein